MAEILSFAFVLMNVKCASISGAFMVLSYIVMRHMTDTLRVVNLKYGMTSSHYKDLILAASLQSIV